MKISPVNAATIKGMNAIEVFRCKAADMPDRQHLESNELANLDHVFGDDDVVMVRIGDCTKNQISAPIIGSIDWRLRMVCGNADRNQRPQIYLDDHIEDGKYVSHILVMKMIDSSRMPSDDWRVYVRAHVYDAIKNGTIALYEPQRTDPDFGESE